ncbi:WD40 repeat domain-containing protein [Shewanella sp.]|uniref:WD40 repeat domain-containing protein n=1 Tax=Shewanella sp. TaxID=50422 RepID=UPI0040487B3D
MTQGSMLLFCSTWLCVWCLSACQPAPNKVIEITTDASYSASLSDNAQLALVSTANNGVQVWDLTGPNMSYQWLQGKKDDTSNVIDTAMSANNTFAATISHNSLAIWRLDDGSSVGWWSLPSYAQSVAIANNGQTLVGLVDGSVMSLSPQKNRLIQFLGHQEKVNSVSISADGQTALTGGNDGKVMLWNSQTGQPIQQWILGSRITKVLINHSGSLSFAADITGNAAIWQSISGSKVSQLNIVRRQMNFSSARFVKNDQQLLTGTPSKELFLWQINSGKALGHWQVQLSKNTQNRGAVVYSAAMTPQGTIVSISSQGLIEYWQQ